MGPLPSDLLIGLLIFCLLVAVGVLWFCWPYLVSESKLYHVERELALKIRLADEQLGLPDYATYIPEEALIIGYYPYASWGDQGVVEVRFSPNSEQRRILDDHFGLEVKNTA